MASRRVELHREVASRLVHHWGTEAPRIAAEIAHHCEEGRDHEGAVAFRGHAGDNAARLFAYAEAEEHYDWAFRSFEKLPAEGRPAAAIALHRRRGAVRLAQARFDDATADFESMLAVARGTGAPEAELAALAGLCDALFFARRVEEMAARAQGAARGRHASGRGRRPGRGPRADRPGARRRGALRRGRPPMLDGAIDSARRVGGGVPLKIALSYRGLVHYWQTEYQAAETTGVEAVSLTTQLGDGFYALGARMFLGLARANLGRISEALDDFADAIAVARRNGDRYWLPRLVSHLGWVHRELGALERAREYDTEAVRARPGAARRLGPGVRGAPEPVRRRRPGGARRAGLRPAGGAPGPGGGEHLDALDERASAGRRRRGALGGPRRPRAGPGARGSTDRGGPRPRGARLPLRRGEDPGRSRARAGRRRLEPAARDLAAALAELRRFPAPLEVWKSARLLAMLRRRLGDEDGARAAFAEAARAIATIAAGTRDEALRGRLPRPAPGPGGARRRPRGGARAHRVRPPPRASSRFSGG